MIQRIQTVYLLLSAVAIALTFALPQLGITNETGARVCFTACHGGQTGSPWGAAILGTLSMAITVLAVLSYGNRRRQMRLCTFAILSTLLEFAALLAYAYYWTTGSIFLCPASCSAPLAILFLLLARRAIRHDEALVRAADRLR